MVAVVEDVEEVDTFAEKAVLACKACFRSRAYFELAGSRSRSKLSTFTSTLLASLRMTLNYPYAMMRCCSPILLYRPDDLDSDSASRISIPSLNDLAERALP